jgi:cell shape-determining protein MreD
MYHLSGRQTVIALTKKMWKNEYFQTAIVVVLVVTLVFGFWYGSQLVFNTKIPPALAVVSGSMDTVSDGRMAGWTHPFARTLQIGDLIIIQGVDPKTLSTNYPESDIIVFHRPDNPSELIVHRIAAKTNIDGVLHFFTKGDGNPPVTWPSPLSPYMYDQWYNANISVPQGAVSQDLVVGKVIMRIPLIGYIPMFMHDVLGVNNNNLVIPIIVLLIILLIIAEFVIPLLKHKEKQPKKEASEN